MKEYSLIMCSCDAYSDLWDGFFKMFQKYWKDFSGEFILNTETKDYRNEDGLEIKISNCQSNYWSERLYRALEKCNTDYVVLILEDFYFKSSVLNDKFLKALTEMKNNPKIVSISFQFQPGIKKAYAGLGDFYERKRFSLYKINASMTMYRKKYLMSLLRKKESPWEFEMNGTVRSWFKPGITLCRKKDDILVFPYDGTGFVRHGKFVKEVKEYFEMVEGLTFSEKREVLQEVDDVHSSKQNVLLKILKYGIRGFLSMFSKRIKPQKKD